MYTFYRTYDADPENKIPPLTELLKIPKSDSPFRKSKGLIVDYERSLRGVAREVAKLIKGYNPHDPISAANLERALKAYAELIDPWARYLAGDIVNSANNQDIAAWKKHTKQMAESLRQEIINAPIGDTIRDIFEKNVLLIKSIPLEAAKKVHKIIEENMMVGERAKTIAEKIMNVENITKSRATLIARTEISKATTALTEARSLYVGSEGYIWRTAGDSIVRKSHKEMNGKFVRWDTPPLINEGTDKKPNMIAHHAGDIWNCRCWPDPVIPEGGKE